MWLNKVKLDMVLLLVIAIFGGRVRLIYQAQATEPKTLQVIEKATAPKTETADKEKQLNQVKEGLQGKWLRMAVQHSVPQLDEDWRFEKGKNIFLQHKAVRSAEELKRAGTATYELVATRTPHTIDLKLEDGKEVRGIYLLADDVLIISLSKAGAARPSQFTADPKAGQELWQFQREKPKSRKPAN